MKFIDLFAGLGGFHLALSSLSHECVFASEIKKSLAELYEKNFEIPGVHCDIKKVHEDEIPPHDIMCAGFPCQPFSKAGKQLGINDERGQFLVDFERILKKHQPKYFILENVPNLTKHDREETWKNLKSMLEECNYQVYDSILSPHEFGIPQIRKRIYIVGIHRSIKKKFKFPEPKLGYSLNIRTILEKNPENARKMSEEQIKCTDIWQSIIQEIPDKDALPSYPIWSMEFKATYPFEKKTPYSMSLDELKNYRGSFGKSLKDANSKEEALKMLPTYARTQEMEFPSWKINYIRQNRDFYKTYESRLSKYIAELEKFPGSWQKFEWNCAGEKRSIYDNLIQFRASGIRVKRTNYAPALVVNTTQLPIIGWEKRYLTLQEAARLQHIEGIALPEVEAASIKALGNAVNVHIIYLIAKNLVGKKRGPKKRPLFLHDVAEDLQCQVAL